MDEILYQLYQHIDIVIVIVGALFLMMGLSMMVHGKKQQTASRKRGDWQN